MADTKISALTDGTTADATDKIPVERSGANRYITPAYLETKIIDGSSDTQVLFNDAGAVAGDAGLTYNKTTNALTIAGGYAVIGDGTNPVVPTLSVVGGTNTTGTALSGVAITGTAGEFSCSAATLEVGQTVTISGTLGGTGSITGYANPTTYRISVTNGSTTFTLVNAATGAAIVTTAGTPTGLTYTVTSATLRLTQTWNNSAVTFTGMRFNVTDTASAAASLLLDFQVGGSSRFKVKKDGTEITGGTNAAYLAGSGTATLGSTGQSSSLSGLWFVNFATGTMSTNNRAFPIAFGNDVLIQGDAANVLAQRNSTTAQTFRVYNTYTDSSNYQRLTHAWNTSTALIHNEGAGTGADGSIAFNDAALATNATKGFIMIPSCAGAPTGVPADIPTGQIPIVFDSTNNKLYVYDGGWISTAALT